ncbi:MAG TPA: hypothetical protein VFY48_01840 [Solirubrobacterales bacterium]|nr:hypothetical protein [Solirubrobacterales bacterium]
MRRAILGTVGCVFALIVAAPAQAGFGLNGLDLTLTAKDGTPSMGAGSHPFALNTTIRANTTPDPDRDMVLPEGSARNLGVLNAPGLVGNPTAVPPCSTAEFLGTRYAMGCADATVIGVTKTSVLEPGPAGEITAPVFNLSPPPGVAMSIGFWTIAVPTTVDLRVNPEPPYNVIAEVRNIPNAVPFYASELTLWGVPASPAHNAERGNCVTTSTADLCPVSIPEKPLLTLPTKCDGPLPTTFEAESWEGDFFAETILSHDNSEPPVPTGLNGCGSLGFDPEAAAKPTTRSAESPSGLDFTLAFDDEGLTSPTGTAQSTIEKAVVAMPKGMTLNPSVAEGLGTCSIAELDRETATSEPGEGCPLSSKVGEVEVETPLLEGKLLHGSLYVATQDQNTLGTRFAIYMVIKDRGLGIVVKQAGEVSPDEQSGQIVTTFEDIPQFPFSEFRFHFREGARSPLVTPPACGTYQTVATFTPHSGAAPRVVVAPFAVDSGVNGGPCPPAGTPPFRPGFEAGTQSNSAGSYSPFYMRLTRSDGDQDLTRFSATLPPGMVAKLAGAGQCSEAAIVAARARTSGREELAAPSCPASSQIGRVLAGAGVGQVLTWAKGSVYLAGPLNGAPLSVVAIVPAVAGPFDLGNVVTRLALRIDPITTKVLVDGAASDPIPHILEGIPLKVRDVRTYVDRPEFTLNPTSCEPSEVGATLWGGGADVFGSGDDSPFDLAARFQAASCGSLGFQPRLSLKLKGDTKRGGNPVLRGEYRPRPGDANLKGLVLRLPNSAFLDQAHIRTICTRVQFAADSCPPGAIYGKATAWTPLLEQPLSGPVYLRASSNPLPDFVADLHGLIDVEAVARIDSKNGGIRATFVDVPDAPLTKVVVEMRGGKKGLIENSADLCRTTKRANAQFAAHNGKRADGKPLLQPSCGGKRGK